MSQQKYRIISIKSDPRFSERGIDWFASKFGIDRKENEKSFDDCINKNEKLPQWYLMIDEDENIVGGCGLIQNDFVDRTDLFPYLCALFVEEKARGNALGSKLLEHARIEGGKLGFDKLYLCTDHTSYYEKYEWKYIGIGCHDWGDTSRIYEAPTIKDPVLERMDDFFAARVDGYDEHMLNDVQGCKEGYIKMAELIPASTKTLLDLGCGTGLELDEIFRRFPDILVVGIDLTQVMLDRLHKKHKDKNIKLICGDYFKVELGESAFDTAISFQTMHHFEKNDKVELYKKIHKSLKPKGVYIECDYMVEDQMVENELFAYNKKLRQELSIPDGAHYHFDTPCTIENQIKMFKEAGFATAEKAWRVENTTIIVAKK